MNNKGAEILLLKYLKHFVKRACQAIRLANHVASRSSKHYQIITKVISKTGFGMFMYIIINSVCYQLFLIFLLHVYLYIFR